jgi:hypothetical protein
MNIQPIWLVYVVLLGTLVFLFREHGRRAAGPSPSYESAIEAAKLMKDWGSWMTTVSTAVIGTNGLLVALEKGQREPTWSYLSVLFFTSSIVFAAWVLGSLPSVVIRLRKEVPIPLLTSDSGAAASATIPQTVEPQTTKLSLPEEVANDIYEMRFFSFTPVRVGVIAALQHIFFVLGLYCFALYVTNTGWEVVLRCPW